MIKSNLNYYIAVLILVCPACSTWQYGNVKYPSSDAALHAAISDMNNTVNSIEALPAPLAKSALVVIPNLERIHIAKVVKSNLREESDKQLSYIENALRLGFLGNTGSLIQRNLFGEIQHYELTSDEQHTYMAKILQLGFQGMTNSLIRRNLFGDVRIHEEYDTSNPPPGNEDYVIWLYLSDQGLGQWHMKTGNAVDGKKITMDISKVKAAKVMTWLTSIQNTISSSASGAEAQALIPSGEPPVRILTGEGFRYEKPVTSGARSSNEDYLRWSHLTDQGLGQWYLKGKNDGDHGTTIVDRSREHSPPDGIQGSSLSSGPSAVTQLIAPGKESFPGFSQGTGFVISSDGYILTSQNVVNDCKLITMQQEHGDDVLVIIAADPENGLALLKSTGEFQDVALFSKNRIVDAEEQVSVVGYPFSGKLSHQAQLLAGVVFVDSGQSHEMNLLQSASPLQPGHSGGPLIDQQGNIVGIVARKLNARKTSGETGEFSRDINYAIRSSGARILLDFHNVNYRIGDAALKKLGIKEIGAQAVKYTRAIRCWQ